MFTGSRLMDKCDGRLLFGVFVDDERHNEPR
jgi:hypothetical protein